ncbi:EcsC family protein [Tessaracoccus palaemonis]|uniref:EcsC family protein n=1 Tax=Tessaracoccus palaemonis TaxID=2829499 RepID=A0ABX8SIE7_9ACTN|nr:EcsC family protein [Tessaracoccus palaemonis]QXT63116.1 EcsC family protein [Tessaracoccus palaemonis]
MSEPNQVVALTEGITAGAFHEILDLAIEGRGKLPGAKQSAKQLLLAKNDAEDAIARMVTSHVAMASGQGFATNWGGFLVSIVTIPANVTAAAFIQARLVAGIAHLRGYELSDPRVRTAILMVMLGPSGNANLVAKGVLPSSPLVVATAPVFDARLDRQVAKALLDRSMNQLTGKRFGVWLGKRIPMVGGGVGAVVDGWSTASIAKHAQAEFPSRRPKLTGTVVQAG